MTCTRAIASRLKAKARYAVRKHILHNVTPVDEWFHNNGDDTLSVTYPLDRNSVVFEVGGYNGTWSFKIVKRYDPYLYVFEPVRSFYDGLKKRFSDNRKVRVFHFGLSDQDEKAEIRLARDGSSPFRTEGKSESIQLRDICTVINELKISHIDLIQINIEGGEYRLLRRMLEIGMTERCSNIQVQFHTILPDASSQREEIRKGLEGTHSLLYDYPFVWESWRLNDCFVGPEDLQAPPRALHFEFDQ
jgi:FkbM family methyltransferase